MGAYWLAEKAAALIEERIKAEIADALADIRVQRGDAAVTTEIPKEYYQYEIFQTFRHPAVFIIVQGQDFQNDRGQNHINATDDILVAVEVEDRTERLVTLKAWRYQSALVRILHHATLTSGDSAVRLFSRVENCEFSGVERLNADATPSSFRKEVSLRLAVEHVENFTN